MTVKTFLLACFLHILLFTALAIPEIARADLDKAIAYAEAGEKVLAYDYYGRVSLKLYNANELHKY